MQRNGGGSIIGKMKLHRQKCTKIITNVVVPSLKEELIESMKDKKSSVLVDESTDISTEKHMAVILRYFDEAESQIATVILFEALKKCITKFGMNLANCIGYG